jgi:hypothetical protein
LPINGSTYIAVPGDGGTPLEVFMLWHVHDMPNGEDDTKFIGAYASEEAAEAARIRLLPQPGFRDLPEGFQIHRYRVGEGHWTEGYITVIPEPLTGGH